MKKIMKALLEAKFPAINIDALRLVIESTPAPEIATEILCGLFEMPQVSKTPGAHFIERDKHTTNVRFINYNPIMDSVEFMFDQLNSKEIWVKLEKTPGYEVEEHFTYETAPKERCHWDVDVIARNLNMTVADVKANFKKVTVYGDIYRKDATDTCPLINWKREK